MGEKTAERIALEVRANGLGVSYGWKTSDEKLAERVAEAEAGNIQGADDETTVSEAQSEASDAGAADAGATGAFVTDQGSDAALSGENAGTSEKGAASAAAEAPAAAEVRDGASAATSKPLVVTITGPKKGRWRAGRHFTSEPVTIPAEDLSDAEITALLGDETLTVVTREAD